MTGLTAGADCEVSSTYYIHAVRSLIDYSAIALVGINQDQVHKLQNKALRLMVGAPVWTKITNLQLEMHIAPVDIRIKKNVAAVAAKVLTRPGYTMTRSRIRTAIGQGDHFTDMRWSRHVRNSLVWAG